MNALGHVFLSARIALYIRCKDSKFELRQSDSGQIVSPFLIKSSKVQLFLFFTKYLPTEIAYIRIVPDHRFPQR